MRARSVVLVPVLGLLLAGCGGGDDPAPVPLPTAVATPTATPTSAVPAEAQGTTPQAAAAFVRYYYEQLGLAFSTLNTTTLQRLSAPTCVDCRNIIASFARERAAGKRYSGGEVTVRTAEAVAVDASRTAVTIVYDTAPLVDLTAPTPTPVGGTRGKALEVEVTRDGSSWLVSNIVQVNK